MPASQISVEDDTGPTSSKDTFYKDNFQLPYGTSSDVENQSIAQGYPSNKYRSEDQLNRSLTARQVQMIAIAGVIGTGLFLGTGKSLATGGPASMLICYLIMGIIVYFTMIALGEMSTFIPVAGSFCTFATRFVDDSFGFALTWNYWFNDAVSVASDLTALQLVFAYWTDFPAWIISLIFWIFLIVINVIHVRAYGELEYWLALLKVITIVVFIILGIVVNCGANDLHQYLGFHYWNIPGAPFVGGFGGFASVFVTASFAYGGTEAIGITAGETKNPARTMPKVVRTVFWRILLFYVLAVLIVGINVPYNYPNLSTGESATSPFTLVFQLAGSQVAGSFINAVIVTSVISAGNHALFAGTRLMYTLALEGYAPHILARLTPNRIPWIALTLTSLVAGLCFGSSFIGAGTLWDWLQNLVGVSNQLSWLSIGITSLRFRRAMAKQGKTHLLVYKNWTYPWGPWIVVIGTSVIILVQGWTAFAPWNTSNFFSYYVELFVFPAMFIFWKVIKRTKFVRSHEMDLETDRYIETEEDKKENAYEDSLKGWKKFLYIVKSFFV
jgi:amino acid transporter, AAT family